MTTALSISSSVDAETVEGPIVLVDEKQQSIVVYRESNNETQLANIFTFAT